VVIDEFQQITRYPEKNVDKEEETKLLHRVEMLKKTLSTKQTVHLTIVTTFGLLHGKHSGKVQKVVTIDELFT
jgi:hypothetical protein